MKILRALTLILLTVNTYAFSVGDDDLEIKKNGLEVIIVDFKDGDNIKLFEAGTGVHILSKNEDRIDLSLLPNGLYRIVDNHGRSAEIEKTEDDIALDEKPLGTEYVVNRDAPMSKLDGEINSADELESYYYMMEFNPLEIKQEENLITIVDYHAGDEIKVYEFQSKNHVLTKYEHLIDLSMLPEGKYLIENNHEQIAIVKRIEPIKQDEKNESGEMLIADF